jgi:hypothetical protein
MLKIWINGQAHEGIDEGWIARTIQGFRRDGIAVCIRVAIQGDGIDLAVSAGICPPPSSSRRRPNAREQRAFDLWNMCAPADDPAFPPGQFIECLKRLEQSV